MVELRYTERANKMKKIKFNYLNITGGYDANLNLKAELKEIQGYYFKVFDYHFVVHKYMYKSGYCDGWRVSELTSGCGITKLLPTRHEALMCFLKMRKQKYNGLDFFTTLKQRMAGAIRIYGKANSCEYE